MKFIYFSICVGLASLLSCAQKPLTSPELDLMPLPDYERLLDEHTDRTEKYEGLYNSLHMTGTILTSRLTLAQVDQKARQFLWNKDQYLSEKGKLTEDIKSKTEIFLSFYAPEKKHDDLHKSNSMWKIFLDCGGRRIEGKATKIKLQTVEVQGLYPYHNRFSTPYILSFPVPTSFVDGKESRLTLTGPAGSASLDFH